MFISKDVLSRPFKSWVPFWPVLTVFTHFYALYNRKSNFFVNTSYYYYLGEGLCTFVQVYHADLHISDLHCTQAGIWMIRENKKSEPTVFMKHRIDLSGSQIMTPKFCQKSNFLKVSFKREQILYLPTMARFWSRKSREYKHVGPHANLGLLGLLAENIITR